MEITLKNVDDTKGVIKMEIVKADYAEEYDKSLRNFRQKANLPGFRRGMAPMSIVRKMFGKNALYNLIYKMLSDELGKYIVENKVNILGEPMPNEVEQQPQDFDTQENFEFFFDVAFAPKIEASLTAEDSLPYYNIKVDDELVDKQINSYKANFGSYESVDEAQPDDMIKGTVTELENGQPKEGGIVTEGAVLMANYLSDEEEKAKFTNAKKNSVIVFNPMKAFSGNVTELYSFLKLKSKDAAENLTNDFNFEITEISRHKDAPIDQTLFERVCGKDAVKDEAEFREHVRQSLVEQFTPESDYKFLIDARGLMLQKVGELKFADELIKRWLLSSDKNYSKEKVDMDYPQLIKDITNHLVLEKLVTDNNIQVTDDDLLAQAKLLYMNQIRQYGLLQMPEESLNSYANEMLKNNDQKEQIRDRARETKLTGWLKQTLKLDMKEVTVEEFNKLLA